MIHNNLSTPKILAVKNHKPKAEVGPKDGHKDSYSPSELRSAYATLESNRYGHYGQLGNETAKPYFEAILASLKPGEAITGPVGIVLELVNSFRFSQDQVLPAYQLIDQYAASPDDRLKLADRFQDVLSHVRKHSPSPGMSYDRRPLQAQQQFQQEMEVGHQPAGYSPAELKAAAHRLQANAQGRYGGLGDSQSNFKAITDSLKPGEPINDAVDTMLQIVNGLMFTQDQVIPSYNLIDQFASNPLERKQLTDKFLQTLDKVHTQTPSPGMQYDTRPGLAQKQFQKEMSNR